MAFGANERSELKGLRSIFHGLARYFELAGLDNESRVAYLKEVDLRAKEGDGAAKTELEQLAFLSSTRRQF